MKLATHISWLFVLGGLLLVPAVWAQTASVSGTITDADDGLSLPGANILIAGAAQGAATDFDGNYSITGLDPGTYTFIFSFTGYQNQEIEVTLTASETRTLDVELQSGIELDPIQVTAGRRQEKALDAPASIDVLTARELQQNIGPSSVSALRNVTGVDMSQTGIDRREVVLRGFNNAFSGASYILTDYRQAAAPSLNVNLHSIMPNMTIDLERVEVVRGPGSALYGAGVDAGVVHYLTKDPFQYPGVTVSVSGGEQSLLNLQGRAAGVIGENIGVKVTGTYGQADDFALDPNDAIDAAQLQGDAVARNNDFKKLNINGLLEYRTGENTALIFNGGFSELTATVLSGIGTLQATDFGYTYGQVRFQSGSFFAQAYLNKNNAGDSFVYAQDLNGDGQPDPVVDKGVLYNAQAQYDLSLADGREQLIIGVDLELTRPDTEGTILGRNENDDDINEYGAYIQSTTKLGSKLEVTLAGRGDYNNVVDKFQLSPRVAMVYKPAPAQTLRATYNRAFSSPTANSNFLDIVAATPSATLPFFVRGRGPGEGFFWDRNPAFPGLGAPNDLVASSLSGCFPTPTPVCGAPTPVGLPLGPTYASVYAGIAAVPIPTLTALLQAQGLPVNEQVVGALVALLDPQLTQVGGFSPGVMNIAGSPDLLTDLADIEPLKQTITQTYEVGYKGILNDRVLLAIDGYLSQKKNFIGPLFLETPFVFVPALQGDLTGALATGITNNGVLAASLGQLGLTPEAVAALVVGFASDNLPDATTPVAIVQPIENNPGVGTPPELMLSYRNYGQITYYGVDASIQVLATDALNLFGNISWVSDDFFDNEELDEENTSLSLALNAPTFKAKFGGSYNLPSGFTMNASGRYIKGFPVRSGPYSGDLENYFLIDVGGGYIFEQGLRIDVGVSNLLDDDHREFIGAPKLGRVAIGRLTYTFGT